MDLFIGHYKKILSLLIGLILLFGCKEEGASLENNNVAPRIQGVSSSKEIYGLGDNIEILVSFDQEVLVHSNNGKFTKSFTSYW